MSRPVPFWKQSAGAGREVSPLHYWDRPIFNGLTTISGPSTSALAEMLATHAAKSWDADSGIEWLKAYGNGCVLELCRCAQSPKPGLLDGRKWLIHSGRAVVLSVKKRRFSGEKGHVLLQGAEDPEGKTAFHLIAQCLMVQRYRGPCCKP